MIYDLEKNYFKKNNHNRIKLYEIVNTPKLKWIVDNYDEFVKNIPISWFEEDETLNPSEIDIDIEEYRAQLFTRLSKYLNGVRNKERAVYYSQTTENKGRYFGSGLQGILRQVRHSLVSEFYYDLDMSNAHPTLLLHHCKTQGYACSNLEKFINNRDEYLKLTGLETRSEQKTFLLKMLNKDVKKQSNNHIQQLNEELHNIRQLVGLSNPLIKKYIIKQNKGKNPYNLNGKIMNHVMCDLENQVLLCLFNILHQNGIKIDCLCFDGLMVQKSTVSEPIEDILRFCEEKILETLNIKIVLTEKTMDEGFDIDESLYDNIDVSLYESDLTEKQIDEHTHQCVYGDNDDYAEFFLKLYGSNIKAYDYDTKNGLQFYHWNHSKALWEEQNSRCLMNYVKILRPFFETPILDYQKQLKKMEKKTDEYNEMKEKIKYYKNALKKTKSASFVKGIITFIASRDLDEHINEYINKSIYELPIKNKRVIDLRTQKVKKRTKDDFWSFELDVDFTDDANENIIKDYITSLFKDPDTERYITNLCGYMLSGSIKDRSFYVLHGVGSNGKSVFMDLVQNILTPKLYSTLSDQAILKQTNGGSRGSATPDLICLKDGRLSVMNETNEGNQIDSALIKRLSGNDEITVRQLYKEPITFKTQNKLILISNALPQFDISDQAMLDRVKFIPFYQRFRYKGEEKKEAQKYVDLLKSKYKNDLFSYFVRNFSEDLEPSKLMLQATNEYLKEMNDVHTFIDDNFKIITKLEYTNAKKDEKTDLRVKVSDVWIMYSDYHRENKTARRKKKDFTKLIDTLGIELKKTKGQNYYLLQETNRMFNDDDLVDCEI